MNGKKRSSKVSISTNTSTAINNNCISPVLSFLFLVSICLTFLTYHIFFSTIKCSILCLRSYHLVDITFPPAVDILSTPFPLATYFSSPFSMPSLSPYSCFVLLVFDYYRYPLPPLARSRWRQGPPHYRVPRSPPRSPVILF